MILVKFHGNVIVVKFHGNLGLGMTVNKNTSEICPKLNFALKEKPTLCVRAQGD